MTATRYINFCSVVIVLIYLAKVYKCYKPIPVAARSKAWVYDRSRTGIVGSNSA
jgi:hypothetical protein